MQSLVWAGALNRHTRAAFGMEEEGCTPAITQFTRPVNGWMIRVDKSEAEGIAPTERGGDLGITTNRVAFAREVGAEGRNQVEDDAEVGRDITLRGV
jgi:hypothetical protein